MFTSDLTDLPAYLSPMSRARLGRLDTAAARAYYASETLAEVDDYADEISLAMLRDAEYAYSLALEQLYMALGEEAARSVAQHPALANLPFLQQYELAVGRTFEIAKGLAFSSAEDQFQKPATAESVPPASPILTGIRAVLVPPTEDTVQAQ